RRRGWWSIGRGKGDSPEHWQASTRASANHRVTKPMPVEQMKNETDVSPENLAPLRKAAILLVSIDKDVAAQILRRMTREAVENVTREIASLEPVPPNIRNAVVEEYYNLAL